jgi:hypothetical protein
MSRRDISPSRRHFLFAAGSSAVGAALAARAASAPLVPPTAAAAPAERPGYRRTAHVGNYYRTARL